ncbi:hypothetical protein LINPERPRIM_LOCUS20667 [Linum perenne]
MPLPWNKSKVSTISRLVTDLHSPKHRNSLVVQTGFPASLVDLFYKNRDRLKKPYTKTNNKNLVVGDPIHGNHAQEVDLIDGAESIADSGIEEIQEVQDKADNERGQIHKDRTRKKIIRKLVFKKLRHKKKGVPVGEKEDEWRESGKLGKTQDMKEPVLVYNHRKGKLLISDVIDKKVNNECEDGILNDRGNPRKQKAEEVELQAKSDAAFIPDGHGQSKIERSGSSTGCLLLLLAVLVGLVGGRVVALLLTIVAYLMLKFAGRRKRELKG